MVQVSPIAFLGALKGSFLDAYGLQTLWGIALSDFRNISLPLVSGWRVVTFVGFVLNILEGI